MMDINNFRNIYLKFFKNSVRYVENLIFDLGANDGSDTAFYLAKGFKVVSVEANPVLSQKLAERFSSEITSKQLELLSIGISDNFGVSQFYINEHTDHWSSFDVRYGARDATPYRMTVVKTFPLTYLMLRYGCPYYMKIDIEGFDRGAIRHLRQMPVRPKFISFEEYGFEGFSEVAELGYNRFFMAPQYNKSWARPPATPLEGRFVNRVSTWTDSGLFGLEIPGPWLTLADAQALYRESVRAEDFSYRGPIMGEWFDIHARSD